MKQESSEERLACVSTSKAYNGQPGREEAEARREEGEEKGEPRIFLQGVPRTWARTPWITTLERRISSRVVNATSLLASEDQRRGRLPEKKGEKNSRSLRYILQQWTIARILANAPRYLSSGWFLRCPGRPQFRGISISETRGPISGTPVATLGAPDTPRQEFRARFFVLCNLTRTLHASTSVNSTWMFTERERRPPESESPSCGSTNCECVN